MKKIIKGGILVVGVFCLCPALWAGEFAQFCQNAFLDSGQCPENVCVLTPVTAGTSTEGVCAPQACYQISAEYCPQAWCDTLTNCRGEKVCDFKMIDPPQCGNLSYAGQDVVCCPGLVRRCGVAFLDMTCDMYGDHSEYYLPICIPCGDGICGNFENVCNCPEDCWPGGGQAYKGQVFE